MVFSFFSRKPSATVLADTTTGETQVSTPQPEGHKAESDVHVAGTTSSSAPFDFPKDVIEQHEQPMILEGSRLTPPVLSTMPSTTGSPPPMPPPHTPSPAPEPEVTDPRALHRLISSVPSQTLLDHCLAMLDPESFDAITGRANKTKKRRRKSGVTPEDVTDTLKLAPPPLKPHPVLTPTALQALTAFFRELVPPPQLHCVRCHKQYFELENSDYSCRVAHDDDSTVVERVGTKIVDSSDDEEEEEEKDGGKDGKTSPSPRRPRKSGVLPVKTSVYETHWGCCAQIVEGDGDQGPPDGWCYEGRHTTDSKRARFRADSTPQYDKLKSCHRMKCSRPQVSQGPESTGTPSVVSGATRKRKRNTRASIDYREAPDEDEVDLEEAERKLDEDFIVDDDVNSAGSGPKRRKKDPSSTPARGRGRGRGGAAGSAGGRKKTIKIQDEVKDKDNDSMQVDEPQPGPSTLTGAPRSPPPTPAPQLVPEPSTATKPKKSRGRPPGSKNKAKPSPLGLQREDTLPADQPGPSSTAKGTIPGGRSQVYVEIATRASSKSPSRGTAAGLTRADILSLKAKGSVTSLRDKFEGREAEKKSIRLKKKTLDLGEIVGSSVDNEVEMSG